MNCLASTESVIIGVVSLIVVAIAAYYIARSMKGKIEIQLPKAGYNSGEEVAGRITLTTRKSLQLNRLYVALIGYQVVEELKEGGSRNRRKQEIYRNEVNLLEGQVVPAGAAQVFDFTMVAPGNQSGTSDSGVPGQIAAAVGTAAKVVGALGMGGSTMRRLEWKLEARADLPGVDIAKSEKLRINLM